MSEEKKPQYRKRHLFARSLNEVVKSATKPMMDKQGKLYSALLANWPAIAGEETAKVTRPTRLQFPTHESSGATLHLDVHPAKAPEMHYVQQQMLEQCARYFGYRAIGRIVFHAAPELATKQAVKAPVEPVANAPISDMRELLQRMRARIMSETPQ